MLPHENILSCKEVLNENSSESSDTETLLEEEERHSRNQPNEQWEAIERTLFQENGQQVTDSDLLKECKLWRNTFPHFRVKGNQLDVKNTQSFKENDKNIQTLQHSFSINNLNEKSENLKKTVVDGLVQRLITKLNVNKFTTEKKPVDNSEKAVESTEINENSSDDKIIKFDSLNEIIKSESTLEVHDKGKEVKDNLSICKTESYFERGKLFDSLDEIEKEFKRDTEEERYYKMFDFFEKELKQENFFNEFETKNKNIQKNYKKEKFEIKSIKPPEGEIIGIDLSEKFAIRRRKSPMPDTLTNYIKPVEIKSKINKKQEELLKKIINKKTSELELINHCRIHNYENTSKSINEFSENFKLDSNPEECNITLPKINKFNNMWFKKAVNLYHSAEENQRKGGLNLKKNLVPYLRELTPNDVDEKFIKDLKKEMLVRYKKNSLRFEGAENFNLRRPKIYSHNCEHTHKSLSCGDLPKKNKNFQKKQVNSLLENGIIDAHHKPRSKSTNLNKSKPKKIMENKTGLLPPIESGIIIKELTGRPKIGPKTLSKKW